MKRGRRVFHLKHGTGIVMGKGVVPGTLLVRFDWQSRKFVKVTRRSKLMLL